jgi:monoamine oxidase
VVILEALDRVGGRIHTIPVNGDWVELGAQWIHGRGENPLWKFVQENKVIYTLNLTLMHPNIETR